MRFTLASIIFAASIFSGWIVPPREIDTRVLSDQELALVSAVKRGKEYSNGGRHDLAEAEFRKALKINDKLTAVYNDLGVSLLGQQRANEAIEAFDRALALEPGDPVARDNLARALYRNQEHESALLEYEALIERTYRDNVGKDSSKRLPEREFIFVNKRMATIYYALGLVDEARCHSKLALDYAGYIDGAAHYDQMLLGHLRLLLSAEELKEATKLGKYAVTYRQEGSFLPEILFDYGIALYDLGRYKASKETLVQLLNSHQ